MRFLASTLLLITILVACGDDKKFTYEYEVNGCNTGKHSFDSKEAYCKALQEDDRNKGCALSLREDAFKRDCEGTFSRLP